jgi:hypothetical protein
MLMLQRTLIGTAPEMLKWNTNGRVLYAARFIAAAKRMVPLGTALPHCFQQLFQLCELLSFR